MGECSKRNLERMLIHSCNMVVHIPPLVACGSDQSTVDTAITLLSRPYTHVSTELVI
uniref:Uncharacterized protein n=1 Tax=Manihot esculenta TaxID=3983 RepID=A0A199UAF1_MANES